MAERITNKLVRELSPPETGNRIVYDDRVKGFGIRITAAGARSFILNYRNTEGRERRFTLGPYGPNELSVEKARKEAGERKRKIADGADPVAEKHQKLNAPTVAALCDRYLEEYAPRKRSFASDRGIVEQIVRPRLGKLKVANVRFRDIDALHRALKGTPYRANRTVALLSKMFSLAIRWDLRLDNPAKGIERYTEDKRTRYLTGDEIERLTDALAAYPETRAAKVDPRARNAAELMARERERGKSAAELVRLCLLTGCRRGEALGATWDQFDLTAGIWIKPSAATKQKTEHRAPLSAAAVAQIRDIRETAPKGDDGNPTSRYVFPGRMPDTHLVEIKGPWGAIRSAAGIPDVRMHDLRHTFASILASAGQSLAVIGRLLGHTNPTTTSRYSHLYDDVLRQAAEMVGAVLTGAPSAEVTPLRHDHTTAGRRGTFPPVRRILSDC